MNVIARLEYKLAYYDSAVHRFNHYTTRTPPETIEEMKEAVMKVTDTLTQEDFHGAFQKLLEKLLEFHVCTINKSTHTKKVWKLI